MERKVYGFNDLPAELQLRILSYIPKEKLAKDCTLVCKQWKVLSTDPSLWQCLHLLLMEGKSEAYCRLLNRCTQLRSLILSADVVYPLNSIMDHLPGLPTLKELTISDCEKLRGDTFRVIASSCQQIETLNIGYCVIYTWDFVAYIASLKQLKTLRLDNCSFKQLDDRGKMLPSSCNIECLEMIECALKSQTDIGHVVQSFSSNLRKLIFKSRKWDGNFRKDDFADLVGLCRKLECLDFGTSWSKFTEQGLKQLSSLNELHSLSIMIDCETISCRALTKFFSSLPQLKKLSLYTFEIDDVVLGTIANALELIEDLNLVCNTFTTDDCHVTDEGLERLLCNCRNIQRLKLHNFKLLTGTFLSLIPPSLKYLCIENCKEVDSVLIDRLRKTMPHLEVKIKT